jgi:hypothetical protein
MRKLAGSNRGSPRDLGLLVEYFELFGRKKELDEIIKNIKNAK